MAVLRVTGPEASLREADASVREQHHEAVALERFHGVAVELVVRRRRLGRSDDPQGVRAPLAEGAFERALLAQRLVACSPRWAAVREWASVAARYAGEANGRAEIHQSLSCGTGEAVPGAAFDAIDVDVVR